MVIIKFGDKTIKEKKRIFSKKKIVEDYFVRHNEFINNQLFNIIETSFDIDNPEIMKIVKSNRGLILKSNKDEFNTLYKSFLFDYTEYLKRSYYSSFLNVLKSENSKSTNIFIEDTNFKLSDEVYEIASLCKKLTIVSLQTQYLTEYKNKCFENYGLSVILNSYYSSADANYVIKIPETLNDTSIEYIYNNKNYILYPDISYFLLDEKYSSLLSYGIDVKELCGAINKIKLDF